MRARFNAFFFILFGGAMTSTSIGVDVARLMVDSGVVYARAGVACTPIARGGTRIDRARARVYPCVYPPLRVSSRAPRVSFFFFAFFARTRRSVADARARRRSRVARASTESFFSVVAIRGAASRRRADARIESNRIESNRNARAGPRARGMASRVLANLLVAGGAALARAASQAYRQALANAQRTGVAREAANAARARAARSGGRS